MAFSLAILQQDPDFAALFEKKKVLVKQDKDNLLSAAKNYTSQFSREIEEGTKKRQFLLEEGKEKGLTEAEIFKNNSLFIPTTQTPILNFLYYISKETEEIDRELNILREQYNKEYGHLQEDYVENKQVIREAPEMTTFIYGNMTHDTFKKIKKLKSLSQSPNENEASAAFIKCRELCKKYGLEYDKIVV